MFHLNHSRKYIRQFLAAFPVVCCCFSCVVLLSSNRFCFEFFSPASFNNNNNININKRTASTISLSLNGLLFFKRKKTAKTRATTTAIITTTVRSGTDNQHGKTRPLKPIDLFLRRSLFPSSPRVRNFCRQSHRRERRGRHNSDDQSSAATHLFAYLFVYLLFGASAVRTLPTRIIALPGAGACTTTTTTTTTKAV